MVTLITPLGPRPQTSRVRSASKKNEDAFSIKEGAPVEAAPATSSIQSIQNVFLAYENAKEQAELSQYGNEVLNVLEKIHKDLFFGHMDAETLQGLNQMIEDKYQSIQDPQLQELMREIETRAKVELAKRGISPNSVNV